MPSYKIGLCSFPYGGVSHFDAVNYYIKLAALLDKDPRVSDVDLWHKGDTPITMVRNECMLVMEARKVDFALIIDEDMVPDLYLGKDPEALPFWETSFEFMIDMEARKRHGIHHDGPCVVAAPYCGSPPDESVHAFRWVNHESHHPNPDFSLKTITRHEAQTFRGFKLAAAAATGLMLIDMRGVARLAHPRFYYEYPDETESRKASTEDVVFTRNLAYVGVPTYINWSAWAGHLKTKCVGKPIPLTPAAINRQMRRAAVDHVRQDQFDKVPTQEPPIRVREINSYTELPPTQPPEDVLPSGLSVIHQDDDYARAAWREDNRPQFGPLAKGCDEALPPQVVEGLRDAVLDANPNVTFEAPACSP